MRDLLSEIRQALRSLLHTPTFTVVVILTLAMGIGATTAANSVSVWVLSARVPVRDADRVVALWAFNRANGASRVGLRSSSASASRSAWLAPSRLPVCSRAS